MSCAKTPEPTEMLFSIWTHVSSSNHVLDVVQIAACKCAIFGWPFVKRFALCYWTVVCPVCDVGALWPNCWMDQDETWHDGRPRPQPHCVRWGPSSPQMGHNPPNFQAHVHCGQTAGWIKMPLGMEVGFGPGDFVLDGDPVLPPKRGIVPKFLAHVYCGQTAGWIKMACQVSNMHKT